MSKASSQGLPTINRAYSGLYRCYVGHNGKEKWKLYRGRIMTLCRGDGKENGNYHLVCHLGFILQER